MIFRALVWLAALGALIAVLASDRAPADPVRSAKVAPAGERGTLVLSAATLGEPCLLSPVRHSLDDDFERVYVSFRQPTPWLTALAGTAGQRQALAGLYDALSQAQDGNLAEPWLQLLDVELDRLSPDGIATVRFSSQVWTGVYPAAPASSHSHEWPYAAQLLRPEVAVAPGAILATGFLQELERLRDWWRAYYGVAGGDLPRAFGQSGPRPAYFSTHTLNPHADRWRDELLSRYLQAFVGVRVSAVGGGGLVCWEGHTDEIRQLLDDPRLIRLAWDLSTASPAGQIAIGRAALCDDDPRLAEFAALSILSVRNWELGQAPLTLLEHWPHPVTAGADVRQLPQPLHWFEWRLSPQAGARAIHRLARTTVDTDRLASLIASMLQSADLERRQAAREVFLERLPLRALEQFHSLCLLDWPAAERSVFFGALADRLRVEFREGDAQRASSVLNEALGVYEFAHLARPFPPESRLLELAGQVLFDDALGPGFQRVAKEFAIVEAARDRLHDSNPEIRRRACDILSQREEGLPSEFTADPFLADLFGR